MSFPRLDDMLCGICGKQAVMLFADGARCRDHEFQRRPSQRIVDGDDVVVTEVATRTSETL